jgi:hypothetical protein
VVGWEEEGYESHACIWDLPTSALVDLNPGVAANSSALAAHDQTEVGQAWVASDLVPAGQPHAALWHGTADSFVDLNPAGYYFSLASGGDSGYQVGEASLDGYVAHAALWHGTADSYVDLNPAGASESCANDMYGNQQGGYAVVNGVQDAGLWNGTSDSWTDFGPGSVFTMYNGKEAGCDAYGACIWNGTSSSRTELGPGGVRSMYEGTEAGWFEGLGNSHACIWTGTAASRVDLEAVLAQSYNLPESQASGVYTSGGEIWVVGMATNPEYGDYAILWHYTPDPVPEPSSLLVLTLGLPAVFARFRRGLLFHRP